MEKTFPHPRSYFLANGLFTWMNFKIFDKYIASNKGGFPPSLLYLLKHRNVVLL